MVSGHTSTNLIVIPKSNTKKEEPRDVFQQDLATIKIANVLAELRCDKHSVFQLLEIHKHINKQKHHSS